MKKSIGIQKLEEAMEEHGYLKVAENIGVGQSILFMWRRGERDPKEMKMKIAIKLKQIYNIGFEEWGTYSPILDK